MAAKPAEHRPCALNHSVRGTLRCRRTGSIISFLNLCLPHECKHLAAHLQLPGLLVSDNTLVGGNDRNAQTAQHSGQFILARIYAQAGLGDPLDA